MNAMRDGTKTLPAVDERSRWLAAAVDAVGGQVFFAPECHAAYAELGFTPSSGPAPEEMAAIWGPVAIPDPPAYFCSRGASMGQVPGEVVAAALGVFKPEVVIACVGHGWSLTDAAMLTRARTRGAVAQLERVLGTAPPELKRVTELLEQAVAPLRVEGKPLFAGLRTQQVPEHPLGRMWRSAELLREYRGDAHTAAWTAAGLDAVEIGLLTELHSGMPMRSYWRTKAWDDADFEPAEARLTVRGLIADGALTGQGRALRESIERATDAQCRPAVEALGDDVDELVAVLREWSAELRAQAAYPPSSPQDAVLPAEA